MVVYTLAPPSHRPRWLVCRLSRAAGARKTQLVKRLTCAHASHISRSRTCFSRQPFTAAAGHSAQLCSRCPFRVLRLQ